MQFVRGNGGKTILVRQPYSNPQVYDDFNKLGIVDFYLPADFSKDGEIVKTITEKIL